MKLKMSEHKTKGVLDFVHFDILWFDKRVIIEWISILHHFY